MLTKDKIMKTIDALPDDGFSIEDIIERLILLDKVEQGLQDIKDGRVHSTEEVKIKLERWLK